MSHDPETGCGLMLLGAALVVCLISAVAVAVAVVL